MQRIKITILLGLLLGGIFVAISTTQPVYAVRKSAESYYANLTDNNRLKVRTAMDMAIPRDVIISSILQGLGIKLASPIEANVIGYDPTILPRDYDLDGALDLMEEVFGYKYNDSAELAEDREGYFPMVLLAPTSRDDKMQWAALVTKSFQEIGIDTTLKYANWNIVIPRVRSPAEGKIGFDYEHGGYDAYFAGWGGSPDPDLSLRFGTDMYPVPGSTGALNWNPDKENIHYTASQEVKDIVDASIQDPVLANRLAKLKEFQQWFYDNIPYYIIRQGYDVWAKDPDLKGVDTGFTYPNYRNWTHPTQTALTVHSSDRHSLVHQHFHPKLLNPFISSSYIYTLCNNERYDGLINRYPHDPSVYYGNLAYDNWTTSTDGLVWDFWVREGIKFSDGSEMTVDDVKFSWKTHFFPRIPTHTTHNPNNYINKSNIVVVGDQPGHIRVTLNSFYAYADRFFTVPILSKSEMSQIDWVNDDIIPLGTGPFMMDVNNSDLANGICVMVQNPYYNGSLRDPDGQYVNDNMLEKITIKLGATAAAAVEGLKNGTFDVIDSEVDLKPFLAQLNSTDNADWSEVVLALEWGHQALHINQFSPYWGMNPADPRKFYPGDYDGVPFDLASIFFGILCLATLEIIRKREK